VLGNRHRPGAGDPVALRRDLVVVVGVVLVGVVLVVVVVVVVEVVGVEFVELSAS